MYLSFFGFRGPPFAITCDERFFYDSAAHAEALANMVYTAQQRKGMVLITGEVGTGKTFLGNMLGSRLGPSCLTVVLQNPPQSAKQLLRAVAARAGLDLRTGADKLALIDALEQYLVRAYQRNRLVVLVLDEAQDLPACSLEELRLLWNWEHEGRRLVQIVLIAQPELRRKLLEPKWESLRQRIVLSYHLGPMSRQDTEAYIRHRLAVAADGTCSAEFSPDAISAVFDATDGIPRMINVLCDNALLAAYAKGARRVDAETIRHVLRDMTCWGLRVPEPAAEPASPASGP